MFFCPECCKFSNANILGLSHNHTKEFDEIPFSFWVHIDKASNLGRYEINPNGYIYMNALIHPTGPKFFYLHTDTDFTGRDDKNYSFEDGYQGGNSYEYNLDNIATLEDIVKIIREFIEENIHCFDEKITRSYRLGFIHEQYNDPNNIHSSYTLVYYH